MSRFSVILFIVAVFLLSLPFWLKENVEYFSGQDSVNTKSQTGNYDLGKKVAFFNGQEVKQPPYIDREISYRQNVLGNVSGEKRIEVDLTNQRLYAYEGDRQIYNFLISSGKWNKTPTGTFRIWTKLRFTLMKGGSKLLNTYYYLPNVPYVMYFANDEVPAWRGFGLHGTYWHSNFGHPMSHGCINMKTEEAAQIYYWANPDIKNKKSINATEDNPGTPIIIYGKSPAN